MTRPFLARALAVVAAGVTFIAACGGGTATTAPATIAPATVAPTVAATQAAAASGLPGFSFALPSGFNADKDLEALLPNTIAGETVTKLSMTGDSFMGMGQGTDDLQKVLTQFGKTPADLSVAVGGTSKASVFAFRIKGVDANQLFGAFAAAQGSNVGTVTDVTIAGKAVKKVVDSTGTVLYLYATGDALITVTDIGGGLTDAVLAEIFQNLR
jgi:hypothetical protein